MHQLRISFTADWNALTDATARAFVFDAMQNTARGLERFASRDDGRNALAQKVSTVKLVLGKASSILLSGRTLVVSIDAGHGYAGRVSSRAVAQALSRLLSVKQATNG